MTAERLNLAIYTGQLYSLAEVLEILEIRQACNQLPKGWKEVLQYLKKCEGEGVVVFEQSNDSDKLGVSLDVDTRKLQDK